MAPKRGGGSRGGSRGWGSSSKGWGSSSKGSSSGKSKGIFGGIFGGKSKSKNKNNPYKNGGYPKQKGSSNFTPYSSGGKTVSNSNWPKNQIPAAGTYPKTNSWSSVGGMNTVKGMGTMGSYGNLKSTMKSKGMYNTAVKLGTAYVGYKVAKGVGKTIGNAMWMGYPRIYGTQSHFYGMSSSYRYLGAVNNDCDVFYDIMQRREVLRCDDWGTNRYNRYNNNGIGSFFSGLGFLILICCCCCFGGCGYMFLKSKKKSSNRSQGESFEATPMNDAQPPPPVMEPHNPYPQASSIYPEQSAPAPAPFNSFNPYPTGNPAAPPAMAPPAAYDQAPNYAPPSYQPPPGPGAPVGGIPLAGS